MTNEIRAGIERLGFGVIDVHRVRVKCPACVWHEEHPSDLDAANAAGRHWYDAHRETVAPEREDVDPNPREETP